MCFRATLGISVISLIPLGPSTLSFICRLQMVAELQYGARFHVFIRPAHRSSGRLVCYKPSALEGGGPGPEDGEQEHSTDS